MDTLTSFQNAIQTQLDSLSARVSVIEEKIRDVNVEE